MPTVPTYITDDDFAVYLKVKKQHKSAWTEFIHNALNPITWKPGSHGDGKPIKTPKNTLTLSAPILDPKATEPPTDQPFRRKVIKSPKDAAKAVRITANPNTVNEVEPWVKLCKIHGIPLDGRGKCLQKGCRYA